jgi:hypothetical protein
MFNPDIKLRPSKTLAGIIIFMHLGAILSLYYLNLSVWLLYGVMVFILCSLVYILYSNVFLLSAKAIIKIKALPYGKWLLTANNGNELTAILDGHSYVSNFLIILNFYISSKKLKLPVIIMPDSIPHHFRRQLKILLFTLKSQHLA